MGTRHVYLPSLVGCGGYSTASAVTRLRISLEYVFTTGLRKYVSSMARLRIFIEYVFTSGLRRFVLSRAWRGEPPKPPPPSPPPPWPTSSTNSTASSPLPSQTCAAGLTGDADGLRALSTRADRALPALLRLLASAGGEAGGAAADSLVNLSQDDALSARLVSLGAVVAAMDVMAKRGGEQPGLARSLVMLLANLTQVESGVAALLQLVGKGDVEQDQEQGGGQKP